MIWCWFGCIIRQKKNLQKAKRTIAWRDIIQIQLFFSLICFFSFFRLLPIHILQLCCVELFFNLTSAWWTNCLSFLCCTWCSQLYSHSLLHIVASFVRRLCSLRLSFISSFLDLIWSNLGKKKFLIE